MFYDVAKSKYVAWSGLGHSFALAQLFSYASNIEFGNFSIAVEKSNLKFVPNEWKKIYISQSANLPKVKLDFLITQSSKKFINAIEPNIVTISFPYNISWFSIDYFRKVVVEIADLLHIACNKSELPYYSYTYNEKILFIFDENSTPLRSFLFSTIEKFPMIQIAVTDIYKIGHGCHQQIYNKSFGKILLCYSEITKVEKIKEWFSEANIGYETLDLKGVYSHNHFVNYFLFFIDYLKQYFIYHKINYHYRGLPESLDILR